jgi:hypothetical protein
MFLRLENELKYNSEEINREQMSKDGRKESTTINGELYDVIFLEEWLKHPDDQGEVHQGEILISDPRLQDAVGEHQYYWADKNGEKLGPYDILEKWSSYKSVHQQSDIDKFLDELEAEQPDWEVHIMSLRLAKNNLDRPIWMMDNETQSYPFDGMHRLTRAILEEREAIPVLFWSNLPPKAKLSKKNND